MMNHCLLSLLAGSYVAILSIAMWIRLSVVKLVSGLDHLMRRVSTWHLHLRFSKQISGRFSLLMLETIEVVCSLTICWNLQKIRWTCRVIIQQQSQSFHRLKFDFVTRQSQHMAGKPCYSSLICTLRPSETCERSYVTVVIGSVPLQQTFGAFVVFKD